MCRQGHAVGVAGRGTIATVEYQYTGYSHTNGCNQLSVAIQLDFLLRSLGKFLLSPAAVTPIPSYVVTLIVFGPCKITNAITVKWGGWVKVEIIFVLFSKLTL